MSHLGGKILYGLVNEQEEFLMERTRPWPDMEDKMRSGDTSVQSRITKALDNSDVVGFSLQ